MRLKEESKTFKIHIHNRLLRIWGVEYSKIKAIAKLTAEAQQRDFAVAESAVLVEGLLNTTELLRSFIDVSKRFLGVDGAGVAQGVLNLHRPLRRAG